MELEDFFFILVIEKQFSWGLLGIDKLVILYEN